MDEETAPVEVTQPAMDAAEFDVKVSVGPHPDGSPHGIKTPTMATIKTVVTEALMAHFGPRAGDVEIKVDVHSDPK